MIRDIFKNHIDGGKKLNIERLDRIYINEETFHALFKWKHNHFEFVEAFKTVLTEGMIVFTDHDGDIRYYVFQDTGGNIEYSVYKDYENKKRLMHKFIWHRKEESLTRIMSLYDYTDEQHKNTEQVIITLHATMMAYMEYYGDKIEYVEVNESRVISSNKAKKGKRSKQPVYIRRKIYKVKIDEQAVIRDKARYERHMEKWTVRGHWRTTKTGKRVWVKPHVKGDGTKEGKEYKIK